MSHLRRAWLIQSVAILLFILSAGIAVAQQSSAQKLNTDDESARIFETLERQAAAWNKGDLLEFMETYWKDDRLSFSAGGETARGWKATLEHYQQAYPKEKMGKLHFDELSCDLLSPDAALVLGNWHLDNNGEKKDGNFSLVLRKQDGRWLIIHDHSSNKTKEK
jgi:hypothetical protein